MMLSAGTKDIADVARGYGNAAADMYIVTAAIDQTILANSKKWGVTQADKQSSKRVISGYQTQQQCSTVYDEVRKNIITGYQIYFTYEGMSGTATTNTMYNVGDKIQVKMGISID